MKNCILFVLGHFGHMGGAERQALYLIQHLRRNHDASIAVLGWTAAEGPLAETLQECGCSLFSFPYRMRASKVEKALGLLRLATFIRTRIRPDVILPYVSIHSKPICQVWRLTGARYAWWNQRDEGRGLFGTQAERRALLNAADIVSNSWAGRDFIATTYDIPREKIITYNNGIPVPDTDNLKPLWRARLGCGVDTPLVSMVANITPYKDHATLFQAWRQVLDAWHARKRPEPMLVLAGHVKDVGHVNGLKISAFDLGLGTNLKFLGPIEQVNELMWESDLIVHSSKLEGCPNAVCEAMALAKPVVATDIPGTRQALGQEHWEICLSEPGDATGLADQIMQFLENRSLAYSTGVANRARIGTEFSIEGMCNLLCSLFDGTSDVPPRSVA